MMRLVLLGMLFLAAFITFLVARLPLGLILDGQTVPGLAIASVTGTLWQGRASGLVANRIMLGDADIALRKAPLVAGRLEFDIEISGGPILGAMRMSGLDYGHIRISKGRFDLHVHRLVPNTPRAAVARLDISELVIGPDGCDLAEGRVSASDLALEADLVCREGRLALSMAGLSDGAARLLQRQLPGLRARAGGRELDLADFLTGGRS